LLAWLSSPDTGIEPLLERATDFDFELLSSRTFDGGIQELVYRREDSAGAANHARA
jgi:hypothetical protein